MADKFSWITEGIEELKAHNLYSAVPTVTSPSGAVMTINDHEVINLCSNDYLGLANHEGLKRKAIAALEERGVGPGATRRGTGTSDIHVAFEKTIAEFKGAEAALGFQSGFMANLTVITSFMGKDDAIFSDELNHASIIDGCRLSGARNVRYKHNDMEDLRRVIGETQGYRRGMIVTDGVFSMDGDIAPLPDIVEIAEAHNLISMVDDAHGEGVLGRSGRGLVDHFDLIGRIDLEIGTMSKAFGVMGGYLAADKRLVN